MKSQSLWNKVVSSDAAHCSQCSALQALCCAEFLNVRAVRVCVKKNVARAVRVKCLGYLQFAYPAFI